MACLLPLARLSVSTKPLTRQMELLPHPGAFFFQQKRLIAVGFGCVSCFGLLGTSFHPAAAQFTTVGRR